MRGYVPTPHAIVDAMVPKLFARRDPKPSDVVVDAGCGDGPFMAGILRYCRGRRLDPPKIVGIELDRALAKRASARFSDEPAVSVRHADYLSDLEIQADFVIGNPPYVSILGLKAEEKTRFRQRYATATGRFDLYALFFEQSLRNLRPGGRLCFITPEKYQYVASAQSLRDLFTQSSVEEIHHLPEDSFPGLVTYPVVTTLTKRPPAARKTRLLLRSGETKVAVLPSGASWASLVHGGTAPPPSGHPLEDVVDKVSCGVATGCDEVYVMTKTGLPESLKPFAHPTISGRQLSSGLVEHPKEVLLVPYDRTGRLLPEKELGALGRHLGRPDLRRHLEVRSCYTEGRREWYEYHDSCRLPDILRPKILCKDIAPDVEFWLDRRGTILPRHSVYYIVPRRAGDLERLYEYLRSPAARDWLKANAQRAANGFLRLQSALLKRLPVEADVARAVAASL